MFILLGKKTLIVVDYIPTLGELKEKLGVDNLKMSEVVLQGRAEAFTKLLEMSRKDFKIIQAGRGFMAYEK